MAKSELVDQIREDYLAANQDLAVGPVDAFCAFMVSWLSNKPIVGIGMSAGGMALRMADGQEVGLITPDETPAPPSVAVGISTGGGGSVRSGGSIESPGVAITGRR